LTPPARPFVSIVIPVYNSASTLGPLVEQLLEVPGGQYRLEIILINDASPDRSEEVCAALHEKYPSAVKVLSLFPNAGEYPAVLTGLRHSRGDIAVIMDDDGQNPPSEISRLAAPVLTGECDIAYASYPRKGQALWRRLVSAVYNAIACIAMGKPFHLYLASFRVLNRALLDAILQEAGNCPYLDVVVFRKTRRIMQVPVRHEPRVSGKSGYTPAKLALLLADMLVSLPALSWCRRPKPAPVVQKSWGFEQREPA
jgi:glycosyltransferase involved in cell wall biosynthesis